MFSVCIKGGPPCPEGEEEDVLGWEAGRLKEQEEGRQAL